MICERLLCQETRLFVSDFSFFSPSPFSKIDVMYSSFHSLRSSSAYNLIKQCFFISSLITRFFSYFCSFLVSSKKLFVIPSITICNSSPNLQVGFEIQIFSPFLQFVGFLFFPKTQSFLCLPDISRFLYTHLVNNDFYFLL